MRRFLIPILALAAVLAAVPASAAPAPASYSRSAMSAKELKDLPGALGKVTKAGKVGTIDAAVGDFVLSPCDEVPDNFGGPAPDCSTSTTSSSTMTATATAAAAAATTVLHASETLVASAGPGPSPTSGSANVRGQTAIEENTSGQVRFYFRQRLVYGPSDITWSTYHGSAVGEFTIFRGDYGTNQADNCGTFYSAHCSATRAASSKCRGGYGGPCDVYLEVGTYRSKGDGADKWVMEAYNSVVWNPTSNLWEPGVRTCNISTKHTGLLWTVSGSPTPYRPTQCPVPYGAPFA